MNVNAVQTGRKHYQVSAGRYLVASVSIRGSRIIVRDYRNTKG